MPDATKDDAGAVDTTRLPPDVEVAERSSSGEPGTRAEHTAGEFEHTYVVAGAGPDPDDVEAARLRQVITMMINAGVRPTGEPYHVSTTVEPTGFRDWQQRRMVYRCAADPAPLASKDEAKMINNYAKAIESAARTAGQHEPTTDLVVQATDDKPVKPATAKSTSDKSKGKAGA